MSTSIRFCQRVVLTVLFAATAPGCSRDDGSSSEAGRHRPAITLTGIQITPVNPHVTFGGSGRVAIAGSSSGGSSRRHFADAAIQPFAATARYSDGSSQNITSQAIWSSSDASVATVGRDGTAAASRIGSAKISATFDGRSGDTLLTVERLALQGTGPLRVHPTNRRYFTNDGSKAVYLTGAHTWNNFQDTSLADPPPAFDYTAYLDWMRGLNHNFFRLWIWEQAKWSAGTKLDFWFNPLPFRRTGPGTALDGKLRFDVTKFNQAYFDRLRARVRQAGERGIYVSVMLFDGWSINDKHKGQGNPWRGHPFNAANNVNGINGDPDNTRQGTATHTLRLPAITAIQEAYARKVIDTVNDLDNVLYEISNESDGTVAARDWHYHMIEFIRRYERAKPRQHPVGMTALHPRGNDADLYASPADWISPAADGNLDDPEAADGRKVILYDTDHLCGICGTEAWVWKSFIRGLNPVFMDLYDFSGALVGSGANYDPNDPGWIGVRRALGQARAYAVKMNLAAMTPRPDLASSGYCLAHAVASDAEYLVYLPKGGRVTVDLTAAAGTLAAEWFSPSAGTTMAGGTVDSGASRTLTAPLAGGDVVLYLRN